MRRLLLLGLVACAPYRSGALLADDGAGRAFECLDVHVAPYPRHDDERVAFALDLGNPCRHGVLVDLTRTRVVAHHAGGSAALHRFDPRHELRPAVLDGGMRVREVIAFDVPADLPTPRLLCFELAEVSVADTAPPPVCFSPGTGGAS